MQTADQPSHAPPPRALVRDAMSVRSPRLTLDTSLAEAAHRLCTGGWMPVPVVDDDGRPLAALSMQDIIRAVAGRRDADRTTVGHCATTELPVFAPDAPLEEAATAMEPAGQALVLVVEDSRLVGILTVTDLEGHRLAESELGPLVGDVIKEISPNDLMYVHSWGAYAYAGLTAVQCIRTVLGRLGRPEPRSILDLPCGHGRELRFLKVAFPDAEFGVCDIDADGVEFCARVFGGHPIVSHEDPADVSFDRRYELVWSGSLFTHLSAERWPGFLEMFARAVEPGGLVLFSANGYLPPSMLRDLGLNHDQAEQILEDLENDDFGYMDVNPSWGLALARPRWVKEQIERSPLELVSYERGAWKPPTPAQDVLVCRLPAR